jgi:hypothetical protein
MNLKGLNTWLALIANVGVIGGLIFLGLEVRQNTTQVRSESSYSINEALSMMNSAIYNDPGLADILERGEKDLFSLNETERRQFISYQFDRINLAIHIRALEQDGLTDIHFPYVEFLTKQFRSNPGLQEFLLLVDDEYEGDRELYDQMRTQTK